MILTAQVARQWRRAINRRLQPLGLTEATWLPLLHLARAAEPMRQKDLALSLSLDSSSVVRLLDELQSSGFILRVQNEDRRAKTVELTALGKMTVEGVELVVDAARKEIFAGVPAEELTLAFYALEKISESLSSSAPDNAT